MEMPRHATPDEGDVKMIAKQINTLHRFTRRKFKISLSQNQFKRIKPFIESNKPKLLNIKTMCAILCHNIESALALFQI